VHTVISSPEKKKGRDAESQALLCPKDSPLTNQVGCLGRIVLVFQVRCPGVNSWDGKGAIGRKRRVAGGEENRSA
jgi:hypothetical protein